MEPDLLLGVIADDFTGATDLANNLVRSGMRTVLTIGVPADDAAPIAADAIVVALKSRTIAAADAVAQSLQAMHWLRAQGVGRGDRVALMFDRGIVMIEAILATAG